MKTLWTESAEIKHFGLPEKNMISDVAVIGGGLCGILVAYRLARTGANVVLVEANTLMSGQSAGTTAKITAQHGCVYDDFIEKYGMEYARLYARANLDAIKEYRKIIDELQIDCDFRECDTYIYSMKNTSKMKREAEAQKKSGIDATFVASVPLPFKNAGGVRASGQATFNPIKFAAALVDNFPDNLTVFEHTIATKAEKSVVHLEYTKEDKREECLLAAGKIIFCCHFPFVNAPGFYFARMHQERAYILALKNAGCLDDAFLGIPSDEDDVYGGLTIRGYSSGGEDYILLGGQNHRTGENKNGGKYSTLRAVASKLYPNAKIACRWSTQDCITHDTTPYIGVYSASSPEGWYVATGFNKWGMTTSMLASTILLHLASGKSAPEYAKIFDPDRFKIDSIPKLATDGMYAIRGFIKSNLVIPSEKIDTIPINSAGTIELDGVTVGVYRENETMYHVVNAKCPHLGCRLEWNADEKSWDCPCHGSRFDYKGKLLDDPAQTDIS